MDEIRKKINPEDPEGPSNFPPEAEKITDDELKKDFGLSFSQVRTSYPYEEGVRNKLTELFGEYPAIGAYGLKTEYGQINGRLIWSDGETAIFETPQGKIKMPFKKLVAPSGKTYEQIENKKIDDNHHRRLRNERPKAREMEL